MEALLIWWGVTLGLLVLGGSLFLVGKESGFKNVIATLALLLAACSALPTLVGTGMAVEALATGKSLEQVMDDAEEEGRERDQADEEEDEYEYEADGPSAICNDGTESYSQHRRGTCSHHGGVDYWTEVGDALPT